jgi:hypothetical protein
VATKPPHRDPYQYCGPKLEGGGCGLTVRKRPIPIASDFGPGHMPDSRCRGDRAGPPAEAGPNARRLLAVILGGPCPPSPPTSMRPAGRLASPVCRRAPSTFPALLSVTGRTASDARSWLGHCRSSFGLASGRIDACTPRGRDPFYLGHPPGRRQEAGGSRRRSRRPLKSYRKFERGGKVAKWFPSGAD